MQVITYKIYSIFSIIIYKKEEKKAKET